MSSQVHGSSWTSGNSLVSQPLVNFFARRRIAISLIGFTVLIVTNVFIRRTIPHNPLEFSNAWVLGALVMLNTGLAIRSWSAGTLNKSRELTTHGPYALTRNPLYIGSFLMMFAFCILCKDLPTLLFVAGPMAFLYRLQVMFEEQRLERLFPAQWPSYFQSTPRFIPWRWRRNAFQGWTRYEWMRNREYRALAATGMGIGLIYLWHRVSLWLW